MATFVATKMGMYRIVKYIVWLFVLIGVSARAQSSAQSADSIAQARLSNYVEAVINTFTTGYYDQGPIGWGPYDKIVAFNRLERVRFQYGLHTSDRFSRRVRLSGYAAYGVRDAQLKGGGSVELSFNDGLQRELTLAARHDLMQLGAGRNPFVEAQVARTSLVRSNKARASMTNEAVVRYNHEWREGVQTGVGVHFRDIGANGYVPMLNPDSTVRSGLRVAEIGLSARLSYDEKLVRRGFEYASRGSRYPIVTLDGSFGVKGMMGNEFDFARVEANVLYQLPMGRVGVSQLIVNTGAVFGHVPYPLLKIHEANGSWWYDRQAFSCMNYLEFASDRWVGWFYEHHFQGLLLGNVPLVKRLRLHEVIGFKGVYGALSERNGAGGAPILLPEGMIAPRRPYMEASVGIENIFGLLRVDAIWRLSHRNRVIEGREVDRFRVNVSFQMRF